ncbi:MAG: YlxR family protein [Chloroflexota bacterium]
MPSERARRRQHIPQRTCVGCRQVQAKRSLIRIVRSADGIRVDPTGKAPGRGAYLHDLRSCWQAGLKGSLARALRTELSPEDRQALLAFADALADEAHA